MFSWGLNATFLGGRQKGNLEFSKCKKVMVCFPEVWVAATRPLCLSCSVGCALHLHPWQTLFTTLSGNAWAALNFACNRPVNLHRTHRFSPLWASQGRCQPDNECLIWSLDTKLLILAISCRALKLSCWVSTSQRISKAFSGGSHGGLLLLSAVRLDPCSPEEEVQGRGIQGHSTAVYFPPFPLFH